MGLFKPFQYLFTETDGRSLYEQNGVVSSSNTPKPLPNAPNAWQEAIMTWERSSKYHSIQRAVSVPFGFVLSAAKILRDAFLRSNIDRKIRFVVQQLKVVVTPFVFTPRYDTIHFSEVDMTTLEGKELQVDANMLEGGLAQKIAAGEDQTHEIDLDKKIRMDGIVLTEKANYIIPEGIEVKKSTFGANFFSSLAFISQDGGSRGIAFLSQEVENIDAVTWADKLNSINYAMQASQVNAAAVNVAIQGTIKFRCTDNDLPFGFRMRFIRSTQDIANQNDYELFSLSPSVGTDYSFDVNETIPLLPGERLYLEGIFFGGTTGAIDIGIEFLADSALTFSYTNRVKATFPKAISLHDAYKKVIDKITGQESDAVSDLLAANPGLFITSGNALRGIAGAKVKLKLTDIIRCVDTVLMAGFGVEGGKVRLESRARYYDSTNPIDLGEVKNLSWKPAAEYMHNLLQVGYPPDTVENVNGKYGFCHTHEYSLPVVKKVSKLELISPFKADPFLIEITRWNLEGKTTTDDQTDNDVFLIDVNYDTPLELPEEGPFYQLRRDVYDSVEGVPDPASVFNLRLSPANILKAHYPWLASILKNYEGHLKFNTTTKNRDLKTVAGSVVVDEDADIEVGSLGAPLFGQIVFEFEAITPIDLPALMEANPNRAFKFTWFGDEYTGFTLKAAMQLSTRKEQQFRLLSAPSNDLTKLIY